MRFGLNTSLISVLTVAALCGDAFAAASVRSIGGTGTFASTSSAAAETSARAGSLRAGGYARPGTSVSSASSSGNVTTPVATSTATSGGTVASGGTSLGGRAAATPRLSVGKYIGTPISISTQGKTTEDLDLRIDKLERDVAALEVDKQDVLDGSDYIIVDQDADEVLLDLDLVRTDLELDDGVVVELDADNDEGLKARYLGIGGELNGQWQMVISWEDLKDKLNLAMINKAIGDSIEDLQHEMSDLLATKVDINQGVANARRVMQVDPSGMVVPGDYVYPRNEIDAMLDTKVDVRQPDGVGYALVVNEDGIVEPTGDFYPKTEVYNKTEINQIVADNRLGELGALAYEDKITNEFVADNAAIARSKLAGDIVGVLDWIQWWNDNVPKGPDGEPDGHSYVLSVDQDGNRAWFRVVVDADEEGGSIVEQP